MNAAGHGTDRDVQHLRKKALPRGVRQARDTYGPFEGDPQGNTLCGATPTTDDIGWADVRVSTSPSFALVTCAACRDLRFDMALSRGSGKSMNAEAKSVVIHRDHTFEYRGDTWHVQRLGPIGTPGGEYEIWRDRDELTVSGFYTMAEVREYINRSLANGWLLGDEGDDR